MAPRPAPSQNHPSGRLSLTLRPQVARPRRQVHRLEPSRLEARDAALGLALLLARQIERSVILDQDHPALLAYNDVEQQEQQQEQRRREQDQQRQDERQGRFGRAVAWLRGPSAVRARRRGAQERRWARCRACPRRCRGSRAAAAPAGRASSTRRSRPSARASPYGDLSRSTALRGRLLERGRSQSVAGPHRARN